MVYNLWHRAGDGPHPQVTMFVITGYDDCCGAFDAECIDTLKEAKEVLGRIEDLIDESNGPAYALRAMAQELRQQIDEYLLDYDLPF